MRRGIGHTIKLGLVPFLAVMPGAERLQVTWQAATADEKKTEKPAHDPWDFWVFSAGVHSFMNGESSQNFANWNGNLSANRTTDALKIRIGLYGNYRNSTFTYDDGDGDTTVVSINKDYEASTRIVKSRGPHWSAGAKAEVNSGTFGNVSLGLEGGPVVEYSWWPYADATRRALQIRYTFGVRSYNYREITIYDKLEETHLAHELSAELGLKQKFGSLQFQAEFSQYLHNTSFYNAEFYGNANVKLFKGFSFDVSGNYERVHDQLSLAKGELSTEEVLLQQKQRQTNYQYFMSFGIRYSFGSIFNNVVNPRLGDIDF